MDGNRWNGWIDCTIKPPTPKGGKVAAAALAGATFGGPAGAALASAVTYLWEPPIKGKVRLDLTYNAFGSTQPDSSGQSKGVAPKGGTDEVDWSVLTEDLDVASRCADLEYCAFLTNDETSTQCGLW